MLVDDQEMVRVGFRMILQAEADLTVVAEAGDGATAVDLVGAARPDVVLMDVRMPKMDGIEACRLVRDRHPDVRVMMLTTFDLHDYVHAALRAGASGFMLKDAPAEQLVDAIRIIAHGDALLAPSVTQALIDEIARQPVSDPTAYPGLETLTGRELDVIRLMAKGRSNAEIADRALPGRGNDQDPRRTDPGEARRT